MRLPPLQEKSPRRQNRAHGNGDLVYDVWASQFAVLFKTEQTICKKRQRVEKSLFSCMLTVGVLDAAGANVSNTEFGDGTQTLCKKKVLASFLIRTSLSQAPLT